MDKLFKLIESDMIDLAFNDGDDKSEYEFKEYAKVSISESRINRLYQLIEKHYKDIDKNKIPPKFPFGDVRDYRSNIDREKFNVVLNQIEDFLGDKVDEIIAEVNQIQKDDLVLDSDIFVEKVTNDDVVKQFNGLVKTLEIAIKYNESEQNKLITKNDLLKSFKSQVSRVIATGLRYNAISFDSEEYKKMNEYVDDPSKAFIKYNSHIFEDSNTKIKFEKYSNLNNKEALALGNEEELLDKFNLNKIASTDELASQIIASIKNYINVRDEYIQIHDESEFPPLGRFLYDLKDKITDELPDKDMYLGNNKSSNFIKNFLHNPIDGMTKYIDERIKNYDERDLLKNRWFEDEDTNIDFEKLINDQKSFKDIILNERDNYNKYSEDKKDEWQERQNEYSKHFADMFKNKMNNQLIPQVLQNNKGGFFENLFGTTSKQYKEFSLSLAKMVEDGPQKGDLDGLKDKTVAYLKHKFKDYDYINNEGITEKDIAKLDSTSQGRVRLCLAVLSSIDYAKKGEYIDFSQSNDNDIFKEINKLNKRLDDLDNFQNNLKNDSEFENNNIIDNTLNVDNNIIENDIEKK